MANNITISATVDRELDDLLREFAHEHRMTVSEVVRISIVEYIKYRKTIDRLAQEGKE